MHCLIFCWLNFKIANITCIHLEKSGLEKIKNKNFRLFLNLKFRKNLKSKIFQTIVKIAYFRIFIIIKY